MRKSRVSTQERQEIVALKGHLEATEIVAKYGNRFTRQNVYAWWLRGVPDGAPSKFAPTISHSTMMDVAAPTLVADPITDGGVSFMELERQHCRWPIGKDVDGAFRFCGCECVKDDSISGGIRIPYRGYYCAEHAGASLSKRQKHSPRPHYASQLKKQNFPAASGMSLVGTDLDEELPQRDLQAA